MFPEVECEQYRQPRELAELMVGNKYGVYCLRNRVGIDHDPADAARPGDFADVCEELFAAAIFLRSRFGET